MDLDITRIGKKSAFLMCPPYGVYIGIHGVGGKEIGIAVSAGCHYYGMSSMTFHLTGNKISDHNPPGMSINNNNVQHFPAREHLDISGADLPHQSGISAEKQLLTGLAPGIKSS